MKKLMLFAVLLVSLSVWPQSQTDSIRSTDDLIRRDGQTYFLHNQPLEGAEYAAFLKLNCPVAYEKYQSGYRTAIAGWTLFGCGAGVDLVTMIYSLCSFNQGSVFELLAGLAGGMVVTASIPTLIVGYVKMHKSADIYNSTCVKPTYWSVQASPMGVGLAWHF